MRLGHKILNRSGPTKRLTHITANMRAVLRAKSYTRQPSMQETILWHATTWEPWPVWKMTLTCWWAALKVARSRAQKLVTWSTLPCFKPLPRFEFLEMDVSSLLQMTKSGTQYVIVLTCGYEQITRGIRVVTVTHTGAQNIFVGGWVSSHTIKRYLRTENKSQFVYRLFAAVTVRLYIKNLTTTDLHPQINCQIKRVNCAVQYTSDSTTLKVGLAVTNSYNHQHLCTMCTYTMERAQRRAPFSSILSHQPLAPAMVSLAFWYRMTKTHRSNLNIPSARSSVHWTSSPSQWTWACRFSSVLHFQLWHNCQANCTPPP